jgi:hypothetical protein
MRLVILAAVSALGLGLLAVSGASAMPANGIAIDQAASAGQLAQPVCGAIAIAGIGIAIGGGGERAPLTRREVMLAAAAFSMKLDRSAGD